MMSEPPPTLPPPPPSQQTVGGQEGISPVCDTDSGERYVVFRSFVSNHKNAQTNMVREVLECHKMYTKNTDNDNDNNNNNNSVGQDMKIPWDIIKTSTASFTLSLGLSSCGEDVGTQKLPQTMLMIREAFRLAALHLKKNSSILSHTADHTTPLTGLALVYGTKGYMTSHYDSPTQPGQREEWIAMVTFGNPVVFRCDTNLITLFSGDVLVMDSMAILHGIDKVLEVVNNNNTNTVHETDIISYEQLGLPIPCRIGLLFWQGKAMLNGSDESIRKMDSSSSVDDDDNLLDGITNLFES